MSVMTRKEWLAWVDSQRGASLMLCAFGMVHPNDWAAIVPRGTYEDYLLDVKATRQRYEREERLFAELAKEKGRE